MKKATVSIIFLCTIVLSAHWPLHVRSDESKGWISNVDFAPLQLGVGFCKAQLYDGKVNTFASFCFLGLMQKSSFISFAPINGEENNFFMQCGGLFSASNNNFGITAAPLLNFTEKNYALQLGFCNLSEEPYGMQIGVGNLGSFIQIGAYNIDGKFQIGIVNNSSNIQIGLLNYNPKAFFKWMPLFNFPIEK